MASLITRLRYRGNNSNSPVEDEPPPSTPAALLAQKIHPNLDVLAAELSPSPPSDVPHIHTITNENTNPHPHGLTPRRHPSQRSILAATAERGSTPDSRPPSTSTLAQRRKSPRIRVFQRASQLSPGSPPASLPSTPDQDVYRPGSTKRFVRGLGLAEFGGAEAQVSGSGSPGRVGSSEGARSDDVVDSPTTSTSRGHGRQRDSRSTGTSSSQGNSRPGSGSKHAARPQSAFMTRLTLSDTANQPPSPSDAPTHSRSISETTSQYESAVASLRSSVRNVEALHEAEIEHQSPESTQISPPRTPGPSRVRHTETPNTFGFASPATSNSASVSARPPLPPFSGLNFSIPRRRSHSVGSASGSGSRWSLRKKRSKSSSGKESVDEASPSRGHLGSQSSQTSFPRDTGMSSPHSTKASKRRGRSWSRSRSKVPQSHRSQSSKRRVSAELSAHQATVGASWEADVALALLEMGGRRPLEASPSVTSDMRDEVGISFRFWDPSQPPRFLVVCTRLCLARHALRLLPFLLHNLPPYLSSLSCQHRPGPEDASSSSFPIGDNLSYTQSRAHIYQQRPIDNTGISATTLHSPSRRTDKGKGKDMQPGSQNTVTFTDHDREGNAGSGGSPRAAQSQSSSSKGGGSIGRKTSPPKSALRPQVATSTSLLQPPTLELTLPTPDGSPGRRSASEPSAPQLQSALKVPGQLSRSNTSGSKGKRKADDVEVTPPKDREAGRAKFATEPRSHRASANSGSSYAPSSYHRKRARLSISENDREGNFSTISSRSSSANPQTPAQTPSRAASRSSARATSSRSVPRSHPGQPHRHGPRRSMSEISQTSIPISALISPHAPSISQYSTTFHMRDPKRPPKPFETPWSLRLATPREPGSGSPIHAWMFFIGFIIFPLWWVASFWRIPRTRKMGGTDVEKAVVLDDPQVEFDAKSWRFRCRIMTGISFVTYIPFIVLVAIFAR